MLFILTRPVALLTYSKKEMIRTLFCNNVRLSAHAFNVRAYNVIFAVLVVLLTSVEKVVQVLAEEKWAFECVRIKIMFPLPYIIMKECIVSRLDACN